MLLLLTLACADYDSDIYTMTPEYDTQYTRVSTCRYGEVLYELTSDNWRAEVRSLGPWHETRDWDRYNILNSERLVVYCQDDEEVRLAWW